MASEVNQEQQLIEELLLIEESLRRIDKKFMTVSRIRTLYLILWKRRKKVMKMLGRDG